MRYLITTSLKIFTINIIIFLMSTQLFAQHVNSALNIPSSIYILTAADIKQIGATRIQDILQTVPGIWFDECSYNYSVNSIRSPAEIFSQSTVIMVDGCNLASPLTSSVLYNYLHIPLANIKKIEIHKGGNGVIYGSTGGINVVKIFTYDATESEGFFFNAGATTFNSFSPFIRYGQKLPQDMYVSGYLNFKTTAGYPKNPNFDQQFINIEDTTIANKFTSNDTDGKLVYNFGLSFQAQFIKKIKSSTKLNVSYVSSKVHTFSNIKELLDNTFNENSLDFYLSEQAEYSFSDIHKILADLNIRYLGQDIAAGCGYNFKNMFLNLNIKNNLYTEYNKLSFGINFKSVAYSASISNNKDINFRDFENTEILYAVFFNDEIRYKNLFQLLLGVRAETWTLLNLRPEIFPDIRLLIKLSKDSAIWTGFSRGVISYGYIESNMEYRKQEIPYVEQNYAEYLANQQGLTGTVRQQYLNKYAFYRSLFLPGTDRLYISTAPADYLKPADYFSIEAGIKKNMNYKAFIDVSLYYTRINNVIGLDNDYESKPVIYSEIFDTQSLWPMYYTNMYNTDLFGGEFLCTMKPRKNINVEISYSLIKESTIILSEQVENSIANMVDVPKTPMHILRFRPSYQLEKYGMYFMINTLWATERYQGNKFNYIKQQADDINGEYKEASDTMLQLDFLIKKYFFNKNLCIDLWGKNIFANNRSAYYDYQMPLGYPHTIHNVYGCNISLKWNFFETK